LVLAIRYTGTADFDHFNRLTFLKYCTLPVEEQLDKCIRMSGWQLSTTPALNYKAGNLFHNELHHSIHKSGDEMVNLGHTLFFEKALSGNNLRSCASCHQPGKYFTDGLVANQKIKNDSPLRRNTPTLLYVACQSAQFWDGRAVTLQEQISDVLQSPDEMNASIPEIAKKLAKDGKYRHAFHDSTILIQIGEALTAYISTMQPMNSDFDRYMSGDEQAMTSQQKRGFNLFMGKAQCGSCHFAPVFNGSTPPFFSRSEYEVLGVPGIQKSGSVRADRDLGRYECYPISVYRRAFKTPTVRNSAMTGPYMHNGYFKTLRSVIEFYNNGGGVGVGLKSPEQTLSVKPLHLSQAEMNDLTAFLESLTDNLKTAGLVSEDLRPVDRKF
jgi:cytochrome c peroxidase